MEDYESLTSVTMVTANMFLSVFFLPGVWAGCAGKEPGLFITTPKKMEALRGSCLLIPCHFTANNFNSSIQTSAGWIKSGRDIYDISKSENSLKVIGNLGQRNCTTVFSDLHPTHVGDYFLRVENQLLKTTACADPLQVTVRDSPWRPRINISGGLEDLKEKESVSITCSALTPCPHSPPELTWNLQQDSDRQTEENPDGAFTTKIQKSMTLSDTHDGYNITCSVSYPVDGGKRLNTTETVTLHVSYAPKDTSASISPSGLVSAGSWVKLSCSSRAKPPVSSFSWFRISSEGPVKVSEEQLYSFNVSEGGEFYCVAANHLGVEISSLILLEDKASGLSAYITVKILGTVMLCSSAIIFECWFRSRFSQKPKKEKEEAVYVNRVIESHTS